MGNGLTRRRAAVHFTRGGDSMAARSDTSTAAKGQKRRSFIQPLTAVIRNRGQLTPAELAVYLHLHTYDWDGEGTWVGQKTIAHELGIGERTVRDAVKKLEGVGAIKCEVRPGHTHVYKVKRE
jgi:predicted transcriptional regulator